MRLYETMMTDCTMLDKTTVSDGLGGFSQEWVDGASFRCAIVKDSTMAARTAEKQGVTELYTVTFEQGVTLDYHDVFRREEDGEVFRVTSNVIDSHSPAVATFHTSQVTAERWKTPND